MNNKGHEALEFAGLAGELLLENGAETPRVEDTVHRICTAAGLTEIEVIVFPTGIIINAIYEDVRVTRAKRIHARETNLNKISIINDISRKYACGRISLSEGLAISREIQAGKSDRRVFWSTLAAGSIASGSATILLGGFWADFFPAFMAAALVRAVIGVVAFNLAYVLQIFLAGIFAGFTGSLFVDLGFGYHMDKIIVGALLPLYPGITLTNAVRDFISGDLLSGTLRMVEGLLIAAALANGVGVALSVYHGHLRDYLF